MTTPHANPPLDPVATAYLHALDVRLESADADTRADILTDIREHIAARLDELGHPPTSVEVRGVLADLGSPLDVADEALRRAGYRPPWRFTGRWVPVTYFVLSAVGVALVVVVDPDTSPEWFWPTGWLLVLGAVAVLCVAPLWKSAEKIAGVVAGLGVTFAAFMALAYADMGEGGARSLLGAVATLVALVAPAWLARSAWQRSPAMN